VVIMRLRDLQLGPKVVETGLEVLETTLLVKMWLQERNLQLEGKNCLGKLPPAS
jgi:hypothetical protein